MASMLIEECKRIMLQCKQQYPDNAKVAFQRELEAFAHKCNIDPEGLYKLYFDWLTKGEK